MSPATNPFRRQYTEAESEQSAFLRTFSTPVLEVLPPVDVLWSRFVILRSAPGAGKTSILRVLTPSSLSLVIDGRNTKDDAMQALHRGLEQVGAINGDEQKILGIMVGVKQDYRSLIDLGPEGDGAQKIFFKLLDSRIVVETINAALASRRRRTGQNGRVTFRQKQGPAGEMAIDALAHLADVSTENLNLVTEFLDGDRLRSVARSKERGILEQLDSLMPVAWEGDRGHARLYALPFLAGIEILVDGHPLDMTPVLLIDDTHDLENEQRNALYEQLRSRENDVGRWVAERREAVSERDMFLGSIDGREYELIDLESQIEDGVRGARTQRLARIMEGIGNNRAQMLLSTLDIHQPFTSLLTGPSSIPVDEPAAIEAALHGAREEVKAFVRSQPRYGDWVKRLEADSHERHLDAYDTAVAWRELSILLKRHEARSTPTLFELEPTVDPEEATQLSSSATRGAARLFLADEYRLPYYAGASTLSDLSSRNIRQYLEVAAEMFDLVVSAATNRHRSGGSLTAREQHLQIKAASRALWAAIPHRVPHGPDVRALLHMIADNSRAETYRATAPYAPGVTGIAMLWSDSERLFRGNLKGATYEPLRRALGVAVANNLIEINTAPRQSKNVSVQVLYLNRLLLPHFSLPLQRGGFRELPISQIGARWEEARTRGDERAVPDPALSLPHKGGQLE